MKKTVCFLSVLFAVSHQAEAQMSKYTIAANTARFTKEKSLNTEDTSKAKTMGGGITWVALKGPETPIKGIHYVFQSVGIFEQFSKEEGITQIYAGVGLCNAKATRAFGMSYGMVNHNFEIKKTVGAVSFWTHLQTNNYKWSFWGVYSPNHGYFFEGGRCMDFISNKKCENQILLTNVTNHFYLVDKMTFPSINCYLFFGFGTNIGKGPDAVSTYGPIIEHSSKSFKTASALLEIGWDISYPKDCKTCE